MNDAPKEGAAACSGDAARFSAHLNETGQAFLFREEMDGQQAHVRFIGTYQGREVVWDCLFFTPARELKQSDSGSQKLKHNFIDIGESVACGIPLRVCLNLDRIDLSAIQKMIIMIRNYKCLRQGRHVFGEQSINPGP